MRVAGMSTERTPPLLLPLALLPVPPLEQHVQRQGQQGQHRLFLLQEFQNIILPKPLLEFDTVFTGLLYSMQRSGQGFRG